MHKLYYKVSKKYFKTYVDNKLEKRIRWALNLRPGEIVNDCTGFNRYVIDSIAVCHKHDRGWIIYDVDIEVSDDFPAKNFVGSCSLKHCGVESPLSRKDIEKRHLDWLELWLTSKDGARRYYKGCKDRKQKIERLTQKINLLKSGKHVCNAKGIQYKRWRDGL